MSMSSNHVQQIHKQTLRIQKTPENFFSVHVVDLISPPGTITFTLGIFLHEESIKQQTFKNDAKQNEIIDVNRGFSNNVNGGFNKKATYKEGGYI